VSGVHRLILLLAAALIAGCATPRDGTPKAGAVAPGVYVVRGSGGEAEPVNQGRIGNTGFIVGETGVVAIDTGTSYRHGRELLAAIAGVTDKPVRLAIVTHTRPEFLFGGNAFRERGIPIRMHRKAAQLMAARCENCLKNLKRALGDEAMAGTTMYTPDQLFDATEVLDLIGRPLRVHYFGHSSGPGDVAVLDETSGVLFAGGLVDDRRVPDVHDGELAGWRDALATLRTLPVALVVPAHGAPGKPGVIDLELAYLTRLEARVTQLLQGGASLSEAPDAAGLSDYAGWDQYEIIHRRNASIVFVRLERELLFKQ